MIGVNVSRLVPPEREAELRSIMRRLEAGEVISLFETVRLRKDGEPIDMHVTISPVKDEQGKINGASVIARDISDRKRAEQHLREMQKLESLGLIAGGVAHDFNNLLVGMLGAASLALETTPESSSEHRLLEHVVKASEKAAHLTPQMLAYAGKRRFETERIDISELSRRLGELLVTSIPKTVQLRFDLAEDLPPVEADPGQIQQVIMNLVINAAEAIGDKRSGTVLITTEVQEVDEAYIQHNYASERISPGTYIALEVHDTGCGMDETVKARIFDPFFTTKFTGRGLGLAAVLGIVRGHKGTIRVYSEPGRGSTFKMLLPAAEGSTPAPMREDAEEDLRGSGLVLVIDNEEVVRTAAKATLERYGYAVLLAADGQAGVDLFRDHADEITAVLLDMTMPVMSGEEALRHMQIIRPKVRVIVSSGYNEVEAIRRFTTKGTAAFVQKP